MVRCAPVPQCPRGPAARCQWYSVSSIVTLTAGKYSHQLGCEYIHCIRVQARVRMK